MLPSCEAIVMSERTFLSGEWKEDVMLKMLMKLVKPRQFPVFTSGYMEDGGIVFYKPNYEMQLILEECRNLGKGRTIEFCKHCGFRMFSTKPTPRNVELICFNCLSDRADRFKEMMKEVGSRPILINPPSFFDMQGV